MLSIIRRVSLTPAILSGISTDFEPYGLITEVTQVIDEAHVASPAAALFLDDKVVCKDIIYLALGL
jgi:hypothetical protein